MYKHFIVVFESNDGQCEGGHVKRVLIIPPTIEKSAIDRFLLKCFLRTVQVVHLLNARM